MDWSSGGFALDPGEREIVELPISQQELLGLAYLKHKRDQVVKTGLSFLGSFDGRHRSGKSLAAATFAYLWDPTFYPNFESRLVRDHREFLDAWEVIARNNIQGAVVQVDEAGVSMASADWYEAWLKSITKMVQMFGYLHPIVLFVAPVKDFVDSRLRKMFQGYYRIRRHTNECSYVYPYDVEFNTIRNKWFYRKPVIRVLDQTVVLRRIILGRPPDFLVDRYVAFENKHKPRQLEEFRQDLRKSEAMKQKTEVDLNKTVDYVVENYAQFTTERSKPDNVILDKNMIAYFFKGTPYRLADTIASLAKRKLIEKAKIKAEEVR